MPPPPPPASGLRGRPAALLLSLLFLLLLLSSLTSASYVQLSNSSLHLANPSKSRYNLNPVAGTAARSLVSTGAKFQSHHLNANSNPHPTSANSEKICIGTSNGLAAQHNKTDHLHNLAERYRNCTYVMGNLEITWLTGNVDLSFLESIREITGYLLIAHVEVDRIRMPNLQIIRGRELYRLGGRGETEFALFCMENRELRQLELPNFREILAGSVGFYYNKNLCHTRINWDEIINWPTYRTDFRYEGAQPECSLCDSACHGFCWAEGPEMCQKFSKTNCAEQCGGGRCFGVGPRECCHLFCAAGCTGPERTDCLACRTFYNDGECIQECPPMQRYNPSKFLWEHNPLGKYAFGGKCVTECPGHLLRDNGACVRTCPPNKKPNTNGECVPCSGPCQKECQGVDMIHSGNIDQLVNCTVIEGSLTILESSFDGYREILPNSTIREHLRPMHPDRLEVMKNIREITGYLNIQANHPEFKNLSYFRNLQTIGGRQTTDMFHSLSIIKSSLVSLNLRSLRKVRSGKVIIEDNKELCFADTIEWAKVNMTQKLDDVTIRNNGDSGKCRQNNLTCHRECSPDGCWGSGPDECLSCKNYKLDDICVENCKQASNYSSGNLRKVPSDHQHTLVLSYDAGNRTCKRCHAECREGCDGPGANSCFRCRNVKDGPYCVPECPSHKYNRNGACEECDRSCLAGCSGPSNRLGEGGCNACGKTVFTSANETNSEKLNNGIPSPPPHCIRADEPCPEGYYQEYHFSSEHLQAGGLKVSPGKPVCRRCHHRCKSCTGLGTHVSVCDCAKYVAGEQCEDFCPRDYFANEALGQCFKCSPECNGCFGPTEEDCLSCRVYRIYHGTPPAATTSQLLDTTGNAGLLEHAEAISLSNPADSSFVPLPAGPAEGPFRHQVKFNCTAQCPPDKPHRISESNMLDPYCSENPDKDSDGNPRIVKPTTSTSIILILLVSFLVSVCYFVYRCQIEKDKTVKLTMHLSGIDDVEPLTPSNLKPNLAPLRSIKETELRKGNILGSGFGGTVYQGFWYPEGGNEDRKARPVAIKVLRDNGQPNMNKEFLDEAYIMASVNHPNLVRLLAVCMTPNHLMLVTQLMPLGCLLEYVKKYKNDIGPKNLLEWCKQIAKGMAYLEEHRMVHRDLALRNVLLQTCGRALISDFGLAKFLEIDQNEYSHTGGGRLPIRWLAPECIRERKFTHKSDVWAFGVTVWELLTFGRIPFEEYDTKQVPMEIEKGARLQQPAYMSAEVYKVIYSCWFYQPEKRPSFSALAQDFSKFARDPGRYLICGGIKGNDWKPFSNRARLSLTDSYDEYNSDGDELASGTEEDRSPISAAIPPDLTPSTHNRINENRFAFELSRQLQGNPNNNVNHHSDSEQSPLSKRFSTSVFHPNHLHHHHHHHHLHQEQSESQMFLSQQQSGVSEGKHLADQNNNTIGFVPSTNFRWPAHHTLSSGSIGHRSEQPTDMYDYLMPSPIVDDQSNFRDLYATGYNTRSTQLLVTSGNAGSNTLPASARQPPHSAGLVGVNNEEYFLYVNNNVQLHSQRKTDKKSKRRCKRKSESYDDYDNEQLVSNSFDMTDTPSTSSTASTLSASNNLLDRQQRCLERSRKLSASNGNMPQSLV